jgi:hypothetical protein
MVRREAIYNNLPRGPHSCNDSTQSSVVGALRVHAIKAEEKSQEISASHFP